MKINPYTEHVSCPSRSAASPSQSGGPAAPKAGKSHDTITVGAQTPPRETTFRDLLASRISMEVRHTASPEKLDLLSRQIADGTYQTDADQIAEAIMLLKTL